ncbi:hypothetical protein SKAU_G00047830 [Synaphobranchus kaupii]|uniref:Uncharacterized protein n=1 Tax=Synaphobranchus kaupii TaxID=118154 RepID=A0A9Q1G386_SYNKA|nr:hypothetical protein SKAU_G00047830 [Synaphobranchus kaupii]
MGFGQRSRFRAARILRDLFQLTVVIPASVRPTVPSSKTGRLFPGLQARLCQSAAEKLQGVDVQGSGIVGNAKHLMNPPSPESKPNQRDPRADQVVQRRRSKNLWKHCRSSVPSSTGVLQPPSSGLI